MRDQRVEQLLTTEHVPWEYLPEVAWSDVDREASHLNQARGLGAAGVVIDDLVWQYRQLLEDGSEAPAVILHGVPGRFVLCDGVQRMEAALICEPARTHTDAYLVRSSDRRIIDMLTRTANYRIGVPHGATQAERFDQACAHLAAFEVPQAEVARQFGVNASALSKEVRRREMVTRLRVLGFAEGEKLPQSVITRLSAVHSNPVLTAVARLAFDAKLTTKQVSDFVRDVGARQSEADQLDYIAEYAAQPEVRERLERHEKGRPKITLSVRARLIRSLREASSILGGAESLGAVQITTPEDERTVVGLITSLLEYLTALKRSRGQAA